VKNTNISVEPTLLGWTVALLAYPPFQQTYGYYFSVLDERGFFALPSDALVGVCAVVSIVCYGIYVSATIMFGLRFSNLTNRGIFTKGPYRMVRHPAYIAKNVAWWVSIVPQIAYHVYQGSRSTILTEIVGLVGLTILYYLRAMTEERHLEKDPAYREYQKRVRYRFIPGVF
jgi:protein-S-isoprenylcysteine O-methyltransferase Ste14